MYRVHYQSLTRSHASAIIIDTIAPTATVTGASYNVETGVITFTGTNFTTIAATSVEDITSYMDWTKVWWDIDGDNDSTADGAEIGADDFAFTADKFSNTTVVSGTTMTATLTADAKAALHAVAGFGADGVTDNASDEIDILAGFSRDLAGNVATTDANELAPDYSDKVSPTVTSFFAVRVDQSDGSLDGWTADEIAALTVAAVGSEGDDDYVPADTTALDAALTQAQAVFGDDYTVISAGDAKLVDGSFKADVKIGIQAQMSEIVLEESSIVATLSSGGTATLVAGSIANQMVLFRLTVTNCLAFILWVATTMHLH